MPGILSKEEFFLQPCKDFLHPEFQQHGCLHFLWIIWWRLIRTAIKIYGSLYLVPEIFRKQGRISPSWILQRFLPNLTYSSLFFANYATVIMGVMCYLRRIRGQHYQSNAWIAGFLGPLIAFLCERESRRRELALYTLNQSLEACWRLLASRGYLPWLPLLQGQVIIFSVSLFLWLKVLSESKKSSSEGFGWVVNQLLDPEHNATYSKKIETRLGKMLGVEPSATSEGGFYLHVLSQAIKGATVGYLFQSTLNLLGVIFRKGWKKKNWLPELILEKDALNGGLFMSLLCTSYPILVAGLDHLTGTKSVNNRSISAAFSGVWFFLYPSSDITMFLFVKALAAQWDVLYEAKKVPDIPYGSALLGAIASMPMIYATFFEAHNVRPSYMRWVLKNAPGAYPRVPHDLRPTIAPPNSL